MKKLLLLGGSRYLLPVIRVAKKNGYYTITCDFLPDNTAHKFSDEYHNISIIDKEAVLEIAKSREVDGIMSFACDPGVVTAAYVAEQMNLPFQCSYDTACILQDKGKFRDFLKENGFNCPNARSYDSDDNPMQDVEYFNWPVIVKPVDSAGSKGVTRVDYPEDLGVAVKAALKETKNGRYIIEDFLTFEGFHSSADAFTVDGELKFCTYSDQLFDKEADNPYTPAYIIWPSTMKIDYQAYLTSETQRLVKLLDMKTGIYNIETCVDISGKPYIMEVSPRGGGCKIAEIQELALGANLIEAEVRKAVGDDVGDVTMGEIEGHWCEMVIHNELGQQGYFEGMEIDNEVQKNVKIVDMSVELGDYVEPFTGANKALGDIFLKFDSREELDSHIENCRDWIKINLSHL